MSEKSVLQKLDSDDLIDRRVVVSKEGASLKVTRIHLTSKGKRMLVSSSKGIRYGAKTSDEQSDGKLLMTAAG